VLVYVLTLPQAASRRPEAGTETVDIAGCRSAGLASRHCPPVAESRTLGSGVGAMQSGAMQCELGD